MQEKLKKLHRKWKASLMIAALILGAIAVIIGKMTPETLEVDLAAIVVFGTIGLIFTILNDKAKKEMLKVGGKSLEWMKD